MKKKKRKSILIPFFILTLLVVAGVFIYIYISEADTRKLKSIGYDTGEITFIKEHKIPIDLLSKYKYISKLTEIVNNKSYKDDLLEKYLEVYKDGNDINTIIYMVNNNITYPYSEKLVSLIGSKYFILKNLDRYMSYEESNIDLTIQMVNCNRDYEYYTNTVKTDTTKGLLMLVNKYYYLDPEYVYGDLVEISSEYSNNSGSKLNSEAYEAFKELVNDSEKENLHIRNNYAHRTYSYQEGVYNNYKNKSGPIYADSISARPGFSEHQTGLSLDVGVATRYADDKFQNTKEYLWMKDNSYKYGFILRYPEGKEDITGYNFEAWHYRYVGKEAAKFIYDNDLTLEEYYAYYVDK